MASVGSSSASSDEEEEECKYDLVDTPPPSPSHPHSVSPSPSNLVILTPSMFPRTSLFSQNKQMLDGINRLLIDKQLGIGSFNKKQSTNLPSTPSVSTLCGCVEPNQHVVIACYPVSRALVFVAGYKLSFSNQVVICGLDYHVPDLNTPIGRCVGTFVQALYQHIELFTNNNKVAIFVTVDESFSMMAAANIKQIFRDLSTATRPIHITRHEDNGMYFKSDTVFTHFDTLMSVFTDKRIAFHASCVSSENVVALSHLKRRLDEEVARMQQAKQSPELALKTWFPFTDETYCN